MRCRSSFTHFNEHTRCCMPLTQLSNAREMAHRPAGKRFKKYSPWLNWVCLHWLGDLTNTFQYRSRSPWLDSPCVALRQRTGTTRSQRCWTIVGRLGQRSRSVLRRHILRCVCCVACCQSVAISIIEDYWNRFQIPCTYGFVMFCSVSSLLSSFSPNSLLLEFSLRKK